VVKKLKIMMKRTTCFKFDDENTKKGFFLWSKVFPKDVESGTSKYLL
jgi:hypothetical protein